MTNFANVNIARSFSLSISYTWAACLSLSVSLPIQLCSSIEIQCIQLEFLLLYLLFKVFFSPSLNFYCHMQIDANCFHKKNIYKTVSKKRIAYACNNKEVFFSIIFVFGLHQVWKRKKRNYFTSLNINFALTKFPRITKQSVHS